jgi:hypothetical protein
MMTHSVHFMQCTFTIAHPDGSQNTVLELPQLVQLGLAETRERQRGFGPLFT